MRFVLWSLPVSLALLAAACEEAVVVDGGGDTPSIPANLRYRLEPSGDPERPSGIVLTWDDVADADLESYEVYSRGSSTASFGRRASTTSNTFHDNGVPHLEYAVTAVNTGGGESELSNVVHVDERLALEQPNQVASISLNRAVHLSWTDNAFLADPERFDWYRVYSAGYDLTNDTCGATWALEGTTIAPEFLVAAMPNGVARCFGISAISREGYESLWSPLWHDTPRPDARNVLVFAYQENVATSGFRYWQDLNGDTRVQDAELGLVVDGNRTDIDFWVDRDPVDSSLWFVPEFTGTQMRLWSDQPIADLTAIDYAPASGYSATDIQAVPGYGYVFRIVESGTTRYGALRVTHVSRDYVIFDWSYQTNLGNPELVAHGISGNRGVVASSK
jgi:hypothetical protein